jgi:hypothetical protein
VSDFFEPPPPPPEPEEHRHPDWFGPPENVLPVVVPLDVTLARTPDVALAVQSVDVYPSGAIFHVPLLLRERVADPMQFMVVPLSRFELPVALLVEAAARCEELWPDGGGGGGAGATTQLMFLERG